MTKDTSSEEIEELVDCFHKFLPSRNSRVVASTRTVLLGGIGIGIGIIEHVFLIKTEQTPRDLRACPFSPSSLPPPTSRNPDETTSPDALAFAFAFTQVTTALIETERQI
ncbi:hypothetical protein Droror1_Dr00009801 [Drosera rotundifolia]